MAQAAVAPGLDSLAGMDARADTLTKLEKLSEEIDAALSRRKSNGFLRRAIKNWRRGREIPVAAAIACRMMESEPTLLAAHYRPRKTGRPKAA